MVEGGAHFPSGLHLGSRVQIDGAHRKGGLHHVSVEPISRMASTYRGKV